MKIMHTLRAVSALVLACIIPITGFAGTAIVHNETVSANRAGDTNRALVINRLEQVGYSKAEAIDRVDKMTAGEVDYFAQHPESIKRSGFVILASCIASSIYSSVHNAQKKKDAYISHLNSKIDGYRSEITLLESQKENENVVAAVEKDPAAKAAMEANVRNIDAQIMTKQQLINSLQDEIEQVRSGKEKVPKY